MIIACLLLNFFAAKNYENRLVNKVFMICCMTCPMPMGANGQRNDGSIRPAECRRNGTKHAAAPPKTRSHQPNTACRH